MKTKATVALTALALTFISATSVTSAHDLDRVRLQLAVTSPVSGVRQTKSKAKPSPTETSTPKNRSSAASKTGHASSKNNTGYMNGPTGTGKPGTGGAGPSAGTNSTGVNGPNGPVPGVTDKP